MRKGHDTVTPNAANWEHARFAMNQQATIHNLDLSVPETKAFFEQMVRLRAFENAWNCHRMTIEQNKLNGIKS
jgi:hypothetical protein